MEVSDGEGSPLGHVAKILETGANTVLVVVQGDKELLVPFIQGVVIKVDLKARQLVVDWEPI
jgi:16S rRNA processing protein RimM